MKYMIMIYGNPRLKGAWEGLSGEQRAAGLGAYAALREDLAASGEMIISEALADPSLARTVMVRDGNTITSDGPFAEVKEHLAGFFLVDSENMERATELAARLPEAAFGLVEVRPIMDLSAWET